MPRDLLLDVIYFNVHIPSRMPGTEAVTILRVLHGTHFMGRLRRAVQALFRQPASLRKLHVTFTR